MQPSTVPVEPVASGLRFDPLSLLLNSSPPMLVLSMLLVVASVAVWLTTVIKARQLHRWWLAERAFQADIRALGVGPELAAVLASHPDAIGGRLLAETLETAGQSLPTERDADHATSLQYRRMSSGLALLASISAAAPLAGLFGTVYGIMEAFSRIGREKSAALPVVAPAIGDALITTALGLFAAIPALIAFNLLSRRGELLLEEARTFVVALVSRFGHTA